MATCRNRLGVIESYTQHSRVKEETVNKEEVITEVADWIDTLVIAEMVVDHLEEQGMEITTENAKEVWLESTCFFKWCCLGWNLSMVRWGFRCLYLKLKTDGTNVGGWTSPVSDLRGTWDGTVSVVC